MNLDDLLELRSKEISASGLIEPQSEACLPLVDLMRLAEAPASIPVQAADHMTECERCASLHARMVKWLAEQHREDIARAVHDASGSNTKLGPRPFWKIAAVVSPLASAACLLLAMQLATQTPGRVDHLPDLYESVKTKVRQVDKSFFPLTQDKRVSTDMDELREEITVLRNAIVVLLDRMGDILTEVEKARDQAAESGPS